MSKDARQVTANVMTEEITLRYDYALGEVAGKFMDGLRNRQILAQQNRCSQGGQETF